MKKRIIRDFDKVFYPDNFVVPFTEIVQDRVSVEVLRGCIRGCRFCQAGFLYRPFREKSAETVYGESKALCENTGYDEVSLSSLSTSDHSQIDPMLRKLLTYTEEEKINLSLPSLRIDNFSEGLMNQIKRVRKSGLTFAPEAGTQRMRDVINKNVTEEEVMKTCRIAFEGGYDTVKLYFMMGLPTETDADIVGIAQLAQKVVDLFYENPHRPKGKNVQVSISTATFVPKPFTPFQWASMHDPEDYIARAKVVNDTVKEQLNRKSIKYNWHEADVTVLEGVLARGDRKVGNVIRTVYERGGIFDAWSEYFDYQRWLDAFAECGVDMDFYTKRERSLDEVFPWDFIDTGVTKEFLKREWQNAMEENVTPNCRMRCSGCGAAQFKTGVCMAER
mgnify:CR=1 FL=1